MKEKRFWQNEWHGIKFSELNVKTSMFRVASSQFYDEFYKEFFKRHQNYQDIGAHHREIKSATAKEILGYIQAGSRVLSYGFGLGFVENSMLAIKDDYSLECFEVSPTLSTWFATLHPNTPLHFDMEKFGTYDLIYLLQITYAMPKTMFNEVFPRLLDHLAIDGKLLLIDTSIEPRENKSGYSESNIKSWIKQIKSLFRPFYYFLFKRKGQQLWGWQRDNACLIGYLEKLGFSLHGLEAKDNQSYKVFKRTSDF